MRPSDLAGHPVAGLSWEGFVVEQLIAHLPPLAEFGFHRTAAGAELALVVEHGGRRIGYEVKLSNAPRPARGLWTARTDLGLERAWVIAPLRQGYPLAGTVEVIPPQRRFATLP